MTLTAPLQQGGTVTLATVSGTVTGQIALGPDGSRGPAYWDVDIVLYGTNRPGVAPIPRIQIFLDNTGDPSQLQMQSYDGSFGSAPGSCRVARGQRLIAVFTGGTAGDIAYFTVTGTKGNP